MKSKATNPSSAGIVRLGNNESVGWRNAANASDLLLKVNASDVLEFNGSTIISSGNIVNADINASAAIAYSKLAALTASRALVSDVSGYVSASSVTSTELGYVSGVTSAIQTQIDAKQSRSILTTKGDIYAATASATVTRLGVGTNGQILTADSAEATGIKWATPATVPVTTKGDLFTYSTTATRLAVGTDGHVLQADSTQATGLKYAQYFARVEGRYKTAAGQSISNNTETIVNFATSDFDSLSTCGTVTTGASFKFTASVDCTIAVNARVMFAGTTGWADTEIGALNLRKNGTQVSVLDRKDAYGSASSVFMSLQGYDIIRLSATDYIDVTVYQNSGASLALQADALHNYISFQRIG